MTAAVLAAGLTGCGGGSGSSGSSTGGSATVAPAPAPAPSPAPSFPPAPFGITATTPFVLVGWQEKTEPGKPDQVVQASERAALTWSATEKTYVIALADLDSGRLFYTFPNGNQLAFSVLKSDGTTGIVNVSLFAQGAATGQVYWQTPSAAGTPAFVSGRAIFGVAAAPLPASGRRVFVTGATAANQLVVDLATRKVSGTLIVRYDNGWDPAGPLEQVTLIDATLAPDGSFVAQGLVAGSPTPGEVRGQLLGPGGNDLALYWAGQVRGPYGGAFETWRDVSQLAACAGCP